jgi:hypothetical protein
MKTMIDYALESLQQIKPGSRNLIDKECQIIYHEAIEHELDSMTAHREEI